MSSQGTPDTKTGGDGAGLDYPRIEAMVLTLADAVASTRAPASNTGDKQAALRLDYQVTVDLVKLLSDIRFRCLVFVTAVIAVANALLPGTGDPGTRVALGLVGFLATLGITVYELRNSQLYEAASHRAKVLETHLGVVRAASLSERAGGVFNEREPYVNGDMWKKLSPTERADLRKKREAPLMRFWFVKVKHDHGLALIYGAALGGWVYLVADGVLSFPVPGGYWPPAPAGWARVISGLIGLLAFVVSLMWFVHHDGKRYRPDSPPPNQAEGTAAGNGTSATHQANNPTPPR
jgi:hypothetical protein